VHLCYVDDSGKEKVATLSGLLIPAANWSDLISCWLDARRELTERWGVDKHVELHGNKLIKEGKGRFCGGDVRLEKGFAAQSERDAAFGVMLGALSACEPLRVLTVASNTSRSHEIYGHLVTHLHQWAEDNDTSVMFYLDGPQGPHDTDGLDGAQIARLWKENSRNPVHYRKAHRALDLPRRIVEDPVMRESKYDQLIQAADITAYAAYHHMWQRADSPWSRGGPHGEPNIEVAAAYRRLSPRWMPACAENDGVLWLP